MKKLIAICLVLLLAVTTVSATPVDKLTRLADYAPAGSAGFGVIRTDAGYVETVDGLLNSVLSKFPPDAGIPPINATTLLEEMAAGASDGAMDYATLFGPWLGDSVALILPSTELLLENEFSTAVVFDSTDQDAAVEFVDMVLSDEMERRDYEKIKQDDGSIRYEPTVNGLYPYLVTDDVIAYGLVDLLVYPDDDATSLSETAIFSETIEALPESDYNILGYADLPIVLESILEMAPAQLPIPFDLIQMVGQSAIGFTIINERSLVVDSVNTQTLPIEFSPIDYDLLKTVPAESPFVVESNGMGDLIQLGFDGLNTLDDVLREENIIPIQDLGTFIRLSLEGSYMIDLDETLAWLNGDFTAFLRLDKLEEPPHPLLTILPEFALVVSTDNPQSSTELVSGLALMAENAFSFTRFEEGALTIPLGELISSPDLLSLTVTSNHELFVAGTTDSVQFALSGTENNIVNTPTFKAESELFLDDAFSLFYLDMALVREAVTAYLLAHGEMLDLAPSDTESLKAVLSLVDTSSVTASQREEGLVVRMTLTLGE